MATKQLKKPLKKTTPAKAKKTSSRTTKKTSNTELMLCHLSGFAMYIFPLGNLIVPFLIWQLKKGDIPALEEHGREVLNFQITYTIYALLALILVFLLIGLPLILVLTIVHAVLIIRGSLQASEGKLYRYPFTIRFLK